MFDSLGITDSIKGIAQCYADFCIFSVMLSKVMLSVVPPGANVIKLLTAVSYELWY